MEAESAITERDEAGMPPLGAPSDVPMPGPPVDVDVLPTGGYLPDPTTTNNDEEPNDRNIQIKTIEVSTISTSPSPAVVYTHTSSDVKQEPLNVSTTWSTTSTSTDEPVCRICHDLEDENGKAKLISPCGCSGSAQFTHKKCLQKWTSVKGATTCEICNQGYKPKYVRFRQKLLTRQVMCMGSAASLPLLVVIIVGFFLLGEQLTMGKYDEDDVDEQDNTSMSKVMVSVCMIATATFGIFLLCCFSVWAAKVQPQQLDGGPGTHGLRHGDVEGGQRNNGLPQQRVPVPLYFF